MSDSMYLRACPATGSSGLTLLVPRSPVRTTPVTPGLFSRLQLPSSAWLALRYRLALSTTLFHCRASGPMGRGLSALPALVQAKQAPPRTPRAIFTKALAFIEQVSAGQMLVSLVYSKRNGCIAKAADGLASHGLPKKKTHGGHCSVGS